MTTTEAALVRRLATIGLSDLPTARMARCRWADFRYSQGLARLGPPLLTAPDGNTKLAKTRQVVYGLTLAPARESRALNVCPYSTPQCRKACLHTSGRAALYHGDIQTGRITKTAFLAAEPEAFLALLVDDISKARKRHRRPIVVRLNVLSDIRWEIATPWLFDLFDDVTFYDYTKHAGRSTPENYYLTMSASERMSDAEILALVDAGQNVAVVADKLDGRPPTAYHGRPVVNGDHDDYRPVDPAGVIVWLSPKGKAAKLPRGGFVRTTEGFN